MTSRSARAVLISLLCLGLCGGLLSLTASCLGPAYPEDPHCDIWCGVEGGILVFIGIYNFILSILPVTMGLVGIFAEKRIMLFWGLAILFSILALPDIVGLGLVSIFYGGRHLEGTLAIAFCCILMMMCMVEMILTYICMYKMKFSCCKRTEEVLERL